jgi:hypothetical protein
MPLGSRIWLFTKTIVGLERDEFGVYELLDVSDKILYIGYGNIRSSLLRHFVDGQEPIDGAFNFSVEYTWSEEKSVKRQQQELGKYFEIHNKYPKFNKL